MKNYAWMILCTILCVPSAASQAADPMPPAGFRAIFDGKDLAGWHGLNPHSVAKLQGAKRDEMLKKMRDEFAQHWRVENGELVNIGTGPYATLKDAKIARKTIGQCPKVADDDKDDDN